MSDWPTAPQPPNATTIIHPLAVGQPVGDIVAHERTNSATAAAAWPENNRAIFLPIMIERPKVVQQLGIYNGAVAGEVDAGIYSYPGTGTSATRLVNIGKTAMSGANTIQLFNIADTTLAPGVYFLAFNCSTTVTATFFRASTTNTSLRPTGVSQQAVGATELPSTATLATPASAFVPCVFAIATDAA